MNQRIDHRRQTIDDLQARIAAMESNAPAGQAEDPDARWRYRIEFAVAPGSLDDLARIRALLKYSLRNLGLKCVRLRKVREDNPPRTIERKAA